VQRWEFYSSRNLSAVPCYLSQLRKNHRSNVAKASKALETIDANQAVVTRVLLRWEVDSH
jgi:hypothetical protein